MFDIGVVIPTRDKWSRLKTSLRALHRAVLSASCSVSVTVIDDGSRDGTERFLSLYAARFATTMTVLRHEVPVGRSAARNAGAGLLDAARLLFLDDDMVIDTRLLERHARMGDAEVGRGAMLHLPWLRSVTRFDMIPIDAPPRLMERICAVLTDPAPKTLRPFARRSRFECDLHWLFAVCGGSGRGLWLGATGGNLSVSKTLFTDVGGFNPRLGLEAAAEDLEFGLRAERCGGRVVMIPGPEAIHMDHPNPDRPEDFFTNFKLFGEIHGKKLARQMEEYFRGERDILAVGTMPYGI